MPCGHSLRGGLIAHSYNPRYGRFMPQTWLYLEVLEHSGVTQGIGLNALQIEEFSDTCVI